MKVGLVTYPFSLNHIQTIVHDITRGLICHDIAQLDRQATLVIDNVRTHDVLLSRPCHSVTPSISFAAFSMADTMTSQVLASYPPICFLPILSRTRFWTTWAASRSSAAIVRL